MKNVAPALTISTFKTRITGMLTNRQPIEAPITTWARVTISAGGLASVTPLKWTATLSAIGPSIGAAGSLSSRASG